MKYVIAAIAWVFGLIWLFYGHLFHMMTGTPLDGLLAILVALAISLSLYFLPTIVAYDHNHPNFTAIFLLNLFLGWTLIGWVAALVWAAMNTSRERVIYIERERQ